MIKNEYRNIYENQDKHWWYLGMRRINTSLLDRYLPRNKKLKILDAGCGPGSMLPTLQKYGEVIGIDVSDEALKFAKKRGQVKKGNIADLKFKNNSFDLVVCLDVLYHAWVKDDNKAIAEFNRVLKPGGLLLLREPAFNWLRGNEDALTMTKYRFTTKDIQKVLRKYSFKIVKLTYANFFLFPMVLIKRLPSTLNLKQEEMKSDFFNLPKPINQTFNWILGLEAQLMKSFDLPFGSSVICLARKPSNRGS